MLRETVCGIKIERKSKKKKEPGPNAGEIKRKIHSK